MFCGEFLSRYSIKFRHYHLLNADKIFIRRFVTYKEHRCWQTNCGLVNIVLCSHQIVRRSRFVEIDGMALQWLLEFFISINECTPLQRHIFQLSLSKVPSKIKKIVTAQHQSSLLLIREARKIAKANLFKHFMNINAMKSD